MKRCKRAVLPFLLLILAAEAVGFCGTLYSRDVFRVREDLQPITSADAQVGVPSLTLDSPLLPDYDPGLPDLGQVQDNADTAQRESGRFRLYFSRYSFDRMAGDRTVPFDRQSPEDLITQSLMAIVRGGRDPDRGAFESLGGAIRPQINLQIEF
jgi:hypothetical protein